MRKHRNISLVLILVLGFVLSGMTAAYSIVGNNVSDQIRIAIYPSSGGLSETYFFEIKNGSDFLVEKGDRYGDDLTRTPFIKRHLHKNGEKIVYEFSQRKKNLTKSEVEPIYDLVRKLYEDESAPIYRDNVMDSWDITVFYRGKILKGNCFNDWNILDELVDKLISVSPIDVNLREFS